MMTDQNLIDKSMRSVFVGNIPYEATEEKLKEIFSEVGPVLSFKLVYDRETGKPKGYGFCEYKDQETSLSAMRNLNGYEIGGRTLRVDNACTEKSRMEMQSLLQGPVVENPYGDIVEPERAPEAISKAVASLPPEQMFELMKQMKLCIQNNPNEARNMLLQNPQLAYALLQAQVVMRIVDAQTAVTMLTKANTVPPVHLPSKDPLPVPPPVMPSASHSGNSNSSTVTPIPPTQQQAPAFAPLPTAAPFGAPRARPEFSGMPPRDDVWQDRPSGMMSGNQMPYPKGGQDMDLRQMTGPRMQSRMVDQDLRIPPNPSLQQPPMQGFGRDPREMNRDVWEQRPDHSRDPRGMTQDFDLRDPRAQPSHDRFQRDPRDRDMRDVRDRPFDRVDPRTGSAPSGGGMPRGPPIQPPVHVSQVPSLNLGPRGGMSPNVGGAGASDQEKAALIMQVLQLSDEQIAMLPPEQRQSILVLKGQIAKSAQQGGQR